MHAKGRIGLIIPHIMDNLDVALVSSIHRTAAAHGYDTILISGAVNYTDSQLKDLYCRGQNNIYDLILSGDFDGFIMEANLFCSEVLRKSMIERLHKAGKPCVIINYDQPYFPVVSAAESDMLCLTTEHLIHEHGCRTLYCIGGYRGHEKSEERIGGFRQAMDAAGLAYDESCIFYGDYWRDIPRQIGKSIANGSLAKPDGIVCGSDIMAIALCRSLREEGIAVPEDIKVTGCDGSIASQTETVSITTVSSQEEQNGQLAIHALLRQMGTDTQQDPAIPMRLVLGESCGCAELGKLHRDPTRSEIRSYAANLVETHELRRTSTQSQMIRRMAESNDLYDVIGHVMGCCYMIPRGIRTELCLCEDWCRNLNNPSIYRKGGFSDRMLLAIGVGQDDEPEKMKPFAAAEILPSLRIPHEPRLIAATSLHYKGQIFGYLCFTYQQAADIVLDDFYLNWCDAVCTGLHTVQKKLYKAHVNKKIESLSEYAPVLGIYNKRGFISRLTGMMTENGEYSWILMMLSCVDNEKSHQSIPPVNAIVNAVRLKGGSPILASIDESTIAMIADQSEADMTEHTFAQHLANQVGAAYHGAIDIRTEQIAVIRRMVHPTDIFQIDHIISSMCAELRGKMISMQSGTFLYKESFHAVREAIYAEPQKEWTLDGITRSMGISRSHFQRLYKEMFGKSCKEDIITARLERAKWILENTSISVADVAEQCGYLNTSHFIRQFSSKLSVSPTEYRKQVKKEDGA